MALQEWRSAAAEREAELETHAAPNARPSCRQQLAEREAELQHRLAEREAELQEQISEQAELLEQRLSQREAELTARIAELEGTTSATDERSWKPANAELEQLKSGAAGRARRDRGRDPRRVRRASEQVAKANEELVRSRTEIETLQQELAEIQRGRQTVESELQQAARGPGSSSRRELAAASAEVQRELARGVELSGQGRGHRGGTARRPRAPQQPPSRSWSGSAPSRRRLIVAFEDAKARHAAELAAQASARQPDLEEVLRASQERLASQTEKLIEVEERAHSAERQFADAVVRLEEVEAELRHLQMEKALHDLQIGASGGRDRARPSTRSSRTCRSRIAARRPRSRRSSRSTRRSRSRTSSG